MRICIFSDIHGNRDALERMLDEEKENVDLFIFAGDIFGYFYSQREIIDILMSMKNLIAVKGNHERNYLSGSIDNDLLDRYGSSYKIILSDSQLEYLRQLPDYLKISIFDKQFGIFHGGPDDYLDQRVYPDTEVKDKSNFERYEFLILGHTHYRFVKKIGRTLIINPGSLGQPRDGKGFSYCILDTQNEKCQFKSVEVDIQKLLSQVRKLDLEREVYSYLERKYRKVST
ncbi:MAG: metallophosphoesterase family protein [Lachnospiraceae bacterium]|nr:metallophosphoesterase family protein [Lachnospiraceae bacterium]